MDLACSLPVNAGQISCASYKAPIACPYEAHGLTINLSRHGVGVAFDVLRLHLKTSLPLSLDRFFPKIFARNGMKGANILYFPA